MQRTAIINVVGLTESLIGPHTPRMNAFRQRGACARIVPSFPAVTCTAQSTYLTGMSAAGHGIVGNGWYNRELAEVQFWKQSNHVVQGRKLWEELRERDPKFTCAKLFWWYNMYSSADYSITPRPIYPADGRKFFDIYTSPYSIRAEVKKDLGEFPFPTFWGPAAGIQTPQGPPNAASRWIADSAKWIESKYHPSLSLIYLPHLDYNLQRQAPLVAAADVRSRKKETQSASQQSTPPHPARRDGHKPNPAIFPDLNAIDAIVGDLIVFFGQQSVQVILLSEYGITPVNRPIHLNRLFRQAGWITVKDELGLELLDCGASKVFAVADHQAAHVYLNDPSLENQVRSLLEKTEGVETVLGAKEKASAGIAHPRAGELIAVAEEDSWCTYYYWLDDQRAPDFARTVDIHRKPGYDPVELFLDPQLTFPKLKIAWRLLQKKLGCRMLMDVIPLDATLVKGSHGRRPADPADYPVLISQQSGLLSNPLIEATDVYHVLKRHVLG
jgi:predicted AlkP superfamily pyrophosphatase or phosphodiesterase